MRKQIKNILLLGLMFLSLINKLVPKFNIIIFFTNNKETNDNNRALLKYIVTNNIASNYKIYFFSKDGNKYRHYDSVSYKNIWLAPFYFIFSKFCFYDCGTLKIKPNIRQQVISLWHGVPLKKIGLMVQEQSSKIDCYNDFTKILVPHENWKHIYKQCFDCTEDQILVNGFPRNDYLFKRNDRILKQLNIPNNLNYKALWMPTFRRSIGGRYSDLGVSSAKDWDLPILSNKYELLEFNKRLTDSNISLIIKLHPYSILNEENLKNQSNIFFIKNKDLNKLGILNYEFVSCFDALITDYSSILFDFLLIDKPIAFTIDDMDSYEQARGFTVSDPSKYLVGSKIKNANDLLFFLHNISMGIDEFKYEREKIQIETHKYINDEASKQLLSFLNLS